MESVDMSQHDALALIVVVTNFAPVRHPVQELQSLHRLDKVLQWLGFVAVVLGRDVLPDLPEEYSVLGTAAARCLEVNCPSSEVFSQQNPPLRGKSFKTNPDPASVSVHQGEGGDVGHGQGLQSRLADIGPDVQEQNCLSFKDPLSFDDVPERNDNLGYFFIGFKATNLQFYLILIDFN